MTDHPHDCPSPHPMLIAAALGWLWHTYTLYAFRLAGVLLLACLVGAAMAGRR